MVVSVVVGRAIFVPVPMCYDSVATSTGDDFVLTEWRLSQLSSLVEWLTARYAGAVGSAGKTTRLHVQSAVDRRILRNSCYVLAAIVQEHCETLSKHKDLAVSMEMLQLRMKLLVLRRISWVDSVQYVHGHLRGRRVASFVSL